MCQTVTHDRSIDGIQHAKCVGAGEALQASPEQAKAIDTWTANFAVQAATYVAPLVAIQRPPGVQPVAE